MTMTRAAAAWSLGITSISSRSGRRRPSGHARSRTQITRFGVAAGGRLSNQVAEHIGGSARVVLYERRSRTVVIGDAFRSRLEAGLAAWAASMSATAICRPRAPPLGHELPAGE
jgi:hypothetical protein